MAFAPIHYSPQLHFTHIEGFGPESRSFRVGWVTALDEEDFNVRSGLLSKCLVGAFVDHRSFEESFLGSKLKAICRTSGIVSVERQDGCYLFRFTSPEDKKLVLQASPVSVDGGFLVLKECYPSMQDSDMRFDPTGVWVQAHGLPLVHQHNHMSFTLASQIGGLLDIDWIPEGRLIPEKNFLHFKVIIYPGDPLVPGVFVPTGDNRFAWVKFSYERVGKVCMRCGRIGHLVPMCSFPPNVVEDDLRKLFANTKQFLGQTFLADETRLLYDRDVLGKKLKNNKPLGFYDRFVSFEEDQATLHSSSSSDNSAFYTASSQSSPSFMGSDVGLEGDQNSLHGVSKQVPVPGLNDTVSSLGVAGKVSSSREGGGPNDGLDRHGGYFGHVKVSGGQEEGPILTKPGFHMKAPSVMGFNSTGHSSPGLARGVIGDMNGSMTKQALFTKDFSLAGTTLDKLSHLKMGPAEGDTSPGHGLQKGGPSDLDSDYFPSLKQDNFDIHLGPGPILGADFTHVQQFEKVDIQASPLVSPPPGFPSKDYSHPSKGLESSVGLQLCTDGFQRASVEPEEGSEEQEDSKMVSILEILPFRSSDFVPYSGLSVSPPSATLRQTGNAKRKRPVSNPEMGAKKKKKGSSVPVTPAQEMVSRKRKRTSSVGDIAGDIFPLPSVFNALIEAWEGSLYDKNGVWLAAPNQPTSEG